MRLSLDEVNYQIIAYSPMLDTYWDVFLAEIRRCLTFRSQFRPLFFTSRSRGCSHLVGMVVNTDRH